MKNFKTIHYFYYHFLYAPGSYEFDCLLPYSNATVPRSLGGENHNYLAVFVLIFLFLMHEQICGTLQLILLRTESMSQCGF